MMSKKWMRLFGVCTVLGPSVLFGQDTLNYTGEMETYTIPEGVNLIQLELWGGSGEVETVDDYGGSAGGNGGYASGYLEVEPGDILNVYVGGQGVNGAGGWNGGGTGGAATAGAGGTDGFAGSGGGASDIRVGGVELTDRVIVAGGGGGGGRNYVNGTCIPCGIGGNGGAGGGIVGEDGDDPGDEVYGSYFNAGAGAGGATDMAGGIGGVGVHGTPGLTGSLGIGANGINGGYGTAGGAGGGGYYGGGSGAAPAPGNGAAGGGGAGGSSYIGGVMDSTTAAGLREGDGMVVITLVCENEIVVTPTVSDELFGTDGEINLDVSGGNGSYTYDWDTDGTGDFDDMEDLTDLVAGTYIVSVASGAACDTVTETLVVNSQVSIDESAKTDMDVNVYPNPTNGNATISLQGEFTYKVLTVNGQVMMNGRGLNTELIDLSAFEKGIYFVVAEAKQRQEVIRLVKK